MSWVFQKSPLMGGATGEAYASNLRSSGMQPEHVLAREAIQNSVDARLDDETKVEIRFRETRLEGREKLNFVNSLGLEEITKRSSELGLQDPDRLKSLKDPKQSLHLIFVEDYNAVGLGGSPHERTSNFYRLLLSLGDRSKARESEGSGGSYGFGKSVYSANSSIQTIVAYTRWIDQKTGNTGTRLFGCGYYASHDFGGIGYSGRAWWGIEHETSSDAGQLVSPFEDDLADEIAQKLGFELRNTSETGTSILLVDAPIMLSEIRRGIEDWWWPRLLMSKLDVQLISAGGDQEYPRPLLRQELRPFIESFKIATMQAPETAGRTKFQKFNRMGELEIGACGFSVVDIDDDGDPKVSEVLQNSVALIRRPLMVVAYHKASTLSPTAVGAFVCADEIDDHLKRSEPPEHNKWAPESENLRDKEGLGKRVVERVLQGVRSNMRKFQHSAAPPPPPRQKRLSHLERALGAYFTPKGIGASAATPTKSPIHLNFLRSPYAVETKSGKLRLHGTFKVHLSDDAPPETVRLRLSVNCPIVEEEDGEGENLRVTVKCDGEVSWPDSESPEVVEFDCEPGESFVFSIDTEEYEPVWTVRLRPEIERVEV